MREIVDHAINTGIHRRVDHEKVAGKQEDRGDYDSRRGANLFPRRPSDAPHLRPDFLYVRLCLPRPTNGLTHFHKSNDTFGSALAPLFRALLAGAEGFEPPLAVLETAGLAVKPMPLH